MEEGRPGGLPCQQFPVPFGELSEIGVATIGTEAAK
jgi:hypothetical protein